MWWVCGKPWRNIRGGPEPDLMPWIFTSELTCISKASNPSNIFISFLEKLEIKKIGREYDRYFNLSLNLRN